METTDGPRGRLDSALEAVKSLTVKPWVIDMDAAGTLTATSPEQSFQFPLSDLEEVVDRLLALGPEAVTRLYGSAPPYAFEDRPMKAFAKKLREEFQANRFLSMTRSYAVPGMMTLSAVARAGGADVDLDGQRIVAIGPDHLEAAKSFLGQLRGAMSNASVAPAEPGGRLAGPHSQSVELTSAAADVLKALLMYRNVVLEGVAGTGKSYAIGQVASAFHRTFTLVLHPNTGYEDLVEGLRPVAGSFEIRDGLLLEACKEAAQNPTKRFLVVLDEVNRANTAKVMGDLMLALEPSRRVSPSDARVILASDDADAVRRDFPYAVQLQGLRNSEAGSAPSRAFLVVPDNLYVLATMNTTDRSVGQLDLALRRRFVPLRVSPLSAGELLAALDDEVGLHPHIRVWGRLNDAIKDEVSPDAMLGHSYFFEFADAVRRAPDDVTADRIWVDLLLPQLGEILIAFGAGDQLVSIQGRVRGDAPSTPVDLISVHGTGLEVGYLIHAPGADPLAGTIGVGSDTAVPSTPAS